MTYDYIVIGGGVSGVFLTYKLMTTGKSILLIESSNRLGGKLLLNKDKRMKVELGGARFASTHKKVLRLIGELKLTDDIIELPSDDDIVYKMKDKINLRNIEQKVLLESKDFPKKYLQGVTYKQLCYDILGEETSHIYQNMFGYDSEFIHLNAYAMLKMFGADILKKSQYYTLKNGYESIISKMKDSFTNNVEIKMNTAIHDIGENYVLHNKTKQYFRKCVMCVPKKTLEKFSYFKNNLSLNTVRGIPLLRIYMKYPVSGKGPWFKDIKRTITDSYIRQIIPIDYEKGIIMISYTDGDDARSLNDLVKLGDKILIQKVHSAINKIFKITPPTPLLTKCAYWGEGVHMWKSGVNVKEEYEKLLQITPKIFIATESYSMHQCWVEGCLDMVYDVLDKMNVKTDVNIKDKVKDKLKDKVKVYGIDAVLKEKAWIVMEINGRKKIYDVQKWLNKHPGGRDNIMKGIKANNHYKDQNKYPESPMDLFNGISSHTSGDVIQKMLKTDNKLVVYVGLLKKI